MASQFSVVYAFKLLDQFTPAAGRLGRAAQAMSKMVHAAGAALSRMNSVLAGAASGAMAATRAMLGYGRAAKTAGAQAAAAQRMAGGGGFFAGGRGKGAKGGGGMGALALGGALSYATGLGRGLFDTNLKFQEEFNNARAVMAKSTEEDFAAMKKSVIDLSKTTVFSATQIMSAMGELGSAGYEAREAMAVLPQALQMAQAGREPLDKTAEMLIGIKNQFGIGDGQMQHVNDVLSETSRQTLAKLPDLREAFKMAGPFAQLAGVDLETTSAILGALSQKGIKGSLAGTGLRRLETGFLKADKKSLGFLRQYKIDPRSVYDSKGKMKDLIGTIGVLEKRGVKAKDVMKAFGDRAGPILAALLETGSEELRRLVGELHNSEGAAKKMADEQMKGLPGAFNKLKAAVEAARLSIGESGYEGDMTSLIDKTREWVNWFSTTPQWVQRTVGWLGTMLGAMAALAIPAAMMAFAFRTLLPAGAAVLARSLGGVALKAALLPIAFASVFGTLVSQIGFAAAAMRVLRVAFLNPISLTIMGLAGMKWIYNNWPQLKAWAADPLNFQVHFPGAPEWLKEFMDFGRNDAQRAKAAKDLETLNSTGKLPQDLADAKNQPGLWNLFGLLGGGATPPVPQLNQVPIPNLPAAMPPPGMPLPAPNPNRIPEAAAERIRVESQIRGEIAPLQVTATPIEVRVTGQVNGPISGTGSGSLSTNAPRGVSTSEAGSSAVSP